MKTVLSRTLTRAGVALMVLVLVLSGCNFSAPEPTPKPVSTAPAATFTPLPEPPTVTPQPPPPPTATLEPTQPPPPTNTAEPAMVTANDALNVRDGPGTDYTKVGMLDAGQTALAVGRNADSTWWQILFEGGPEGKGWVLGQYVTVNAAAANLPVVAAPPPPPPPTNPPAPPPTQPPAATATSQPPAAQYGVPQLVSPEDEASFHGEPGVITIVLTWQSVGALQPGECYKVRIIHSEGVYDSECVTGTSWTVQDWLFDYRPADRGLLWSLRVVRESDGTQLSPWSATWVFYWFGG